LSGVEKLTPGKKENEICASWKSCCWLKRIERPPYNAFRMQNAL
jgi:hypothetical protein